MFMTFSFDSRKGSRQLKIRYRNPDVQKLPPTENIPKLIIDNNRLWYLNLLQSFSHFLFSFFVPSSIVHCS